MVGISRPLSTAKRVGGMPWWAAVCLCEEEP
jgi:hypothetical protein